MNRCRRCGKMPCQLVWFANKPNRAQRRAGLRQEDLPRWQVTACCKSWAYDLMQSVPEELMADMEAQLTQKLEAGGLVEIG